MNVMKFENVTAAKLQAAKEHLSAKGAVIVAAPDGNSGTISGYGVRADFSFDFQTGVLTVDIRDKPFFVPDAMIQSQISEGLAKA